MNTLHRFNMRIRKLLLFSGVSLLGIFVVAVLLQVLSRNILKVSMDWTSEVAVFAFIWSILLGSAVALSTRRHYVVDLIPARHVKLNKAMLVLSELLVSLVILALIWGGTKFALLGWYRLTTALEIPRFWLFVSLPISAAFMFLFNLENILIDIGAFKTPQGGEEGRK